MRHMIKYLWSDNVSLYVFDYSTELRKLLDFILAMGDFVEGGDAMDVSLPMPIVDLEEDPVLATEKLREACTKHGFFFGETWTDCKTKYCLSFTKAFKDPQEIWHHERHKFNRYGTVVTVPEC